MFSFLQLLSRDAKHQQSESVEMLFRCAILHAQNYHPAPKFCLRSMFCIDISEKNNRLHFN